MDKQIEEALETIELGLRSAKSLYHFIQIPEDHDDPKSVHDCKENIYDAYESYKILAKHFGVYKYA